MNNAFEWKDEYCIGVDEVDKQHQELFNIAGRFAATDNFDDAMAELIQVFSYIRKHFRLEEFIMRKAGYSGYKRHYQLHDQFIDQFSNLVSGYHNSPSERAQIIAFFSDWIVNHIRNDDQKMAESIKQSIVI
jgi:hemerythrin